MIKEAYVSFEVAKLLKEKGFNIPCRDFYRQENETWLHRNTYEYNNFNLQMPRWKDCYTCPTLQMACRWLRDIHHLHIEAFCPVVDVDSKETGVTYNVVISSLDNNCLAVDTSIEDMEYNSYEEAIEAGIRYCLENLI